MKQKRKYTRISFEEAVALVSEYHKGKATQIGLAKRSGLNSAYVSRLCRGEERPEVYAAVEAAERAESGGEL